MIQPTPAGDFKHRLTIIKRATTTVEGGESSPVSITDRKVWAKISPISGTTKYENAELTAQVTHEIRTRYFRGIFVADSFQQGSTTYNVVSIIDPMQEHTELLFLCNQVTNG